MVAGGDDGLPWRWAGRQWRHRLFFIVIMLHGRVKKGLWAFFHVKKQWSLPNIEDSSDDSAFTMILVTPPRRHNGRYLMAWRQHCYGKRAILTSEKESDGNGGVVSPWSISFSSLFSLFGIEFPAKIIKTTGSLSMLTFRAASAQARALLILFFRWERDTFSHEECVEEVLEDPSKEESDR
jgi:hypothetical protein